MRLHEIKVENFGMFRGTELDSATGRFHLVCGPNEAGKSTLLQLIRELLFGFAVQNPYAFPDHAGEMAAEVSAEMKDGARIHFRRRKGKVKVVKGEVDGTGHTFDETGLIGCWATPMTRTFTRTSSVSRLAELASGEKSLKSAGLERAPLRRRSRRAGQLPAHVTAIQGEHESLFLSGRRAQAAADQQAVGRNSRRGDEAWTGDGQAG